jgi:hypothetical protein
LKAVCFRLAWSAPLVYSSSLLSLVSSFLKTSVPFRITFSLVPSSPVFLGRPLKRCLYTSQSSSLFTSVNFYLSLISILSPIEHLQYADGHENIDQSDRAGVHWNEEVTARSSRSQLRAGFENLVIIPRPEGGHTTVARIYDLPGFSIYCGDPTVTADTTKLASHLSSLLTSSEFLYLADTHTPHLSSIFASVTPNCQPQLSSPTPTHGVLTSSSPTPLRLSLRIFSGKWEQTWQVCTDAVPRLLSPYKGASC